MSLSWTWSEVSQGYTCTIKKEKSVVSKAEVPFWKLYLVYGRRQARFLLLQRDCKTLRSWVKATEACDTHRLLRGLNHTVGREGVDKLSKSCLSFKVPFGPIFLWFSDFHLVHAGISKGTHKKNQYKLTFCDLFYLLYLNCVHFCMPVFLEDFSDWQKIGIKLHVSLISLRHKSHKTALSPDS